MKVINLGENNSVLNTFVAELRDRKIQKDSFRFRTNLERVGEIFAYEVSRVLNYSEKDVETPLGIAKVPTFDNKVVIATILRAGLPLLRGLLKYFDKAEVLSWPRTASTTGGTTSISTSSTAPAP